MRCRSSPTWSAGSMPSPSKPQRGSGGLALVFMGGGEDPAEPGRQCRGRSTAGGPTAPGSEAGPARAARQCGLMGEQGANGWGGLSRRTDPQTPATDLGQRGKGNTREQRRRRDNWASTREETRLDEALHTSQKLTQMHPRPKCEMQSSKPGREHRRRLRWPWAWPPFLDTTPKARAVKKRTDQLDFDEIKNPPFQQ